MRRGIATPASDRWQEVREIGLQMREVACKFQVQAREWLERLQAAWESRGEDRSAESERNVESAGQDLTEQDREKPRMPERERILELERSIAREGRRSSI